MPASSILDQYYPLSGVVEAQSDWVKMANKWRKDGVVRNVNPADLNEFAVTQRAAGANMSVDVASGRCWIQGVFGESGTPKNLTVAAADPTNPRIDRVVLSLFTNVPNIVVQVYTGLPAVPGSQVPPALVRSGNQWDVSLYQIDVAALAGTIVNANIRAEQEWSTTPGYTLTPTMASAAAPVLPVGVSSVYPARLLVPVSGTTVITALPVAPAGTEVVLAFQGTMTLTTANNLHLQRPLTTSSVATLTLYCDGTQWWETARANDVATANTVLVGPTSGGAAQATQRLLTMADLPLSTTRSAFFAFNNATQSIPNSALTKVALQVKTGVGYDYLGEFDNTTNYRFTALVAGLYHFFGAFLYNLLPADSRVLGEFYKNGAEAARFTDFFVGGVGNNDGGAGGSAQLALAAGDYVEFFTYHSHSSAVAVNLYNGAGLWVYFAGARIA